MIKDNFFEVKNPIGLTMVQKCLETSTNVSPIENAIEVCLPKILQIWLNSVPGSISKNKCTEVIKAFLSSKFFPVNLSRVLGNFVRSGFIDNWREKKHLMKAIKLKNQNVFQDIMETVINIEIEIIERRRPQQGFLVRKEFQNLWLS